MKERIGMLMLSAAFVLLWSIAHAACPGAQGLFFIQRSVNDNIVQYDVHCTAEGDLQSPEPVHVYWVLENGETEELSGIQKQLAYGVASQKEVGNNHYEFVLTALKDRKIVVKHTADGYRAMVLINGVESILERVYVECTENFLGMPKVLYIDLFGFAYNINNVVRERILPQ